MSKVLTVIRKEYLERVRSKSFLIGTLLGPALMSMFIVLPMLLADSGDDERRTIGVVDPSGLYFDAVAAALQDDDRAPLDLQRVAVGSGGPETALTELKDAILNEDIHSGVFIDPDFLENAEVTFYN